MKNNPLYEEAIFKIRGLIKIEGKNDSEIERRPDSIGNRLMASSLLATGYGETGGLQQDPSSHNIRVKLDKDDDDLSGVDNDAE